MVQWLVSGYILTVSIYTDLDSIPHMLSPGLSQSPVRRFGTRCLIRLRDPAVKSERFSA